MQQINKNQQKPLRKNANLTKHIKERIKSDEKKCLKQIAGGFDEYTNYHELVKHLSKYSLRELKDAIADIEFDRKRFTQWITCTRKEADKPETELRSQGYYTWGEYGGGYGYFKHKQALTEDQKYWLENHMECCYYHGQPCERHQDENGNQDEDCECQLGKEDSSLIVRELDEEEEKNDGVWEEEA